MILDMIRDIAHLDLDESDALDVSKALWALAGRDEEEKLRPIIYGTLVKGEDMPLDVPLLTFLLERLDTFRRTLLECKEMGTPKDAYSAYMFLHLSLGYPREEILPLLEEAVAQGNKSAIRRYYGDTIRDPRNKDIPSKIEAAHRLVEAIGERDAIDLLAMAYENSEDQATYERLVFKGAEWGDPYCCWKAAMFCQGYRDYDAMGRYFEIGKFAEDPDASFEYALSFWVDDYRRGDAELTESLMMRAAMMGSAEAAAHLGKSCLWGFMYREGKEKDPIKALYYLEMADARGHHDAGYFVGGILDGWYEGVPEQVIDRERAMRYWEKLAKRGHGESLMQLGCAYYNGDHGYPKDLDKAWKCYLRSSIRGSLRGGAYYADMVACKEAPGTKEMALSLLVLGLCAYDGTDRSCARGSFTNAYTAGGLFPVDPEWAEYLKTFPIEYQGDTDKTRAWILQRLLPAREEHVKRHPELDDGIDWRKVLSIEPDRPSE